MAGGYGDEGYGDSSYAGDATPVMSAPAARAAIVVASGARRRQQGARILLRNQAAPATKGRAPIVVASSRRGPGRLVIGRTPIPGVVPGMPKGLPGRINPQAKEGLINPQAKEGVDRA